MSDSAGAPDVETELNRDIGLVGACAIGIGTMIAAGIFVLSGLAVGNVGAMAIVSFVIAAVVASFTAFAYGEFSAIYPESGGGYAYVANVFDTDLTYLVGWSMILGYPASAAFYLASFSDWFFRFLYPALSIPEAIPYWLGGVLILGLLIGVNLKGTEETGMFQIVVTLLKVALIALFLYGGLKAFDAPTVANSFASNAQGFEDYRNIAVTSALVFITFFGFEAIATNAEEIERPGTNVPRAIFISMGFVTVVYSLVVLVIVLAVNNPQFLDSLAQQANLGGLSPTQFVKESGEVSMAYAAQFYLGSVGFYVIIVGALLSMLSAANATILAGSRVKLAMARRDHLPDRFERLHPTLNTPYQSVLLTGVLILAYILVFTVAFGAPPGSGGEGEAGGLLGITALTHFADFMLLTGLVVVNLAVIYSRRKDPELERPFRVPAVPYVPAVAIVANLVLLVNVEPVSLAIGLAAEAIGLGIWYTSIRGAPPTETLEEETPTVLADHTGADNEYQVVVPIANPNHVPQLMRTAADLARDNDGEVLVLAAVPLPDQTPLSEGREYADERQEIVRHAMDAAPDDVPVSGTVRVAHHVGHAIINTTQQYGSDAVLLGWGGRRSSHRRDIVMGSIVDEVVQEAPCDVFVERMGDDTGRAESILFPTAGGPHSDAAADVVDAIAHENDSRVELLHVVPPNADGERRDDADAALRSTAEQLDVPDERIERTVLEDGDVEDAIVEYSESFPITVIGATQEGFLDQLVFGAIPESVGERAANTVIMAKRNLAVGTRLRYLLRPR